MTGDMDSLECMKLVVRNNWMKTEGIRKLKERGDLCLETWADRKGSGRTRLTSDVLAAGLFSDLSGDNWLYLPDREPPARDADLVFHVLCQDISDLYVFCYPEEEVAVIQTDPYVWDKNNHTRITRECYRLSADAMGGFLSWVDAGKN